MGNSVTVAVAMHKKYRKPSISMYLPLHVGAAISTLDLGITGDNTGDNISALNASYSELTGLYWLWKNNDSDYKGLVHYRRYLATRSWQRYLKRDRMERVIDEQELLQLASKYGVVVPKKRNYFIETVYSHYAHTMHNEQLDETRKILEEFFPQYVQAFDEEMNSKKVHILNMFVMRKDLFNQYCEFLFNIIGELVRRIDARSYDSFEARFPGRVSERLLDVWLQTNDIKYEEVPVVSIEPVNWLKKGGSFIAAKFFGKRYLKSF